MRSLDYYLNDYEKLYYIKKEDVINCAKNPFLFLITLYEDKINVRGERTEKKLEMFESLFIKAFKNKEFDINDEEDFNTLYEIKMVFEYLLNKFKSRESTILFDSLLYKYRNEIPYLYNEETLKALNKIDDQASVLVEVIFDSLMSGKEIDSFESELLYTYLKNHIDDNDVIYNMCTDCFNKLVKDEKNLTKHELVFAMEYMTYEDWNLSSERPHVYINNFSDKYTYGESSPSNNSIFISTYYIGEPIIDHEVIFDYHEERYHTLSSTLYHEIQHQRQSEYAKNKYISLTTFQYVCRRLISRKYGKKFDEYKENYVYKEIETEANLLGAQKSHILAKEFELDSKDYHYEVFKDYCKKFSKSVQVDEFGIASDVINYNVNNLREIVEKEPNLIKTYPVLGTIFTSKGELKTIDKVVSEYGRILQNEPSGGARRLYNYLFKYYLYNSRDLGIDLFNIKFDSLNDKLTYLMMLEDYIINEHKALENIFDTINNYDLKNEEDLKGILLDKTDKLVEAYAIIKSNKVLDFINIIMNSSDKSLNISKKTKKILNVYLQMNNSDLLEHVKNNPLIAGDPEMHSIARRVDALDRSLSIMKSKRKVIKSRNKQPDYVGHIKR